METEQDAQTKHKLLKAVLSEMDVHYLSQIGRCYVMFHRIVHFLKYLGFWSGKQTPKKKPRTLELPVDLNDSDTDGGARLQINDDTDDDRRSAGHAELQSLVSDAENRDSDSDDDKRNNRASIVYDDDPRWTQEHTTMNR